MRVKATTHKIAVLHAYEKVARPVCYRNAEGLKIRPYALQHMIANPGRLSSGAGGSSADGAAYSIPKRVRTVREQVAIAPQ